MITRYEKSHILILENVFLDDIKSMKDIMIARAKSRTLTEIQTATEVELPKKFESMESWPKYINAKCWHCSLTLQKNRIPVALPLNYTNTSDLLIMDVEGIFCSFPCAMSFAKTKYKTTSKTQEKMRLLAILFKFFYGETIYNIPFAPEKHTMKDYAGSTGLTTIKYREIIAELDPGSQFLKKIQKLLCDENKLQKILMSSTDSAKIYEPISGYM